MNVISIADEGILFAAEHWYWLEFSIWIATCPSGHDGWLGAEVVISGTELYENLFIKLS